jgi:6-phosphogluconolactonase
MNATRHAVSWVFVLAMTCAAARADEYFAYVGAYTRSAGKGIYAYRFAPDTGTLTSLGLAAETPHPSFVAVHPNGRYLYATNEHEGNDPPGVDNTISAFAIDRTTGGLRFLNKVSSRGEGPNHISIDRTGRTLLAANFRNGTVAALPIRRDGRLGEAASTHQHHGASVHPVRQKGPHAHFIAPSPDNRFALSVDLGVDQVIVYRLDPARAILTRNEHAVARLKPGTQPRHLAFHPTAKYVYVNGEASSTISVFTYDARTAAMSEIQTVSTLPAGFSGASTTAEVQVDPAGRFVYVSNRGHDSLAIFGIDRTSGKLSLVDHVPTGGRTPRHFTFDPSGNFLFVGNQGSNNVAVFGVDTKTGRLTPAQVLDDVPEPACIVFVRASR